MGAEEEEVKDRCENGRGESNEGKEEGDILNFLDSMDSYLILMDHLSSILRQGWLELASARHSMGASRISSALFDLKYHNAATSVEVNQDAGSSMELPHFTLCKWASPNEEKCYSSEAKHEEDDLLRSKSGSPQLRHRGSSQSTEITGSDGTKSPNPAYLTWYTINKHLKPCLVASISPAVLPQVTHLTTATAIWQALATRYSSVSRAHVHLLKSTLHTLNKGNQTMQQNLDSVKTITDGLVAAGSPVESEDLLLFILKGLPMEYESFRTHVRPKNKKIDISILNSMLLQEELKSKKFYIQPLLVHLPLLSCQQLLTLKHCHTKIQATIGAEEEIIQGEGVEVRKISRITPILIQPSLQSLSPHPCAVRSVASLIHGPRVLAQI